MSDQAQGEFPFRYTAELAGKIERRWQDRWEEEGTYNVPNPVGDLAGEVHDEKLFLLDMFPYPSGKGLHVGHPFGYIATDVVGRFHRMLGESVLHTMGFDAFGLPAEQFAVQTGQHPRITTENNIATMKEQLRKIGLGHDQRRAFATTDEDYVKWTQWIFLQIFNSYYDPEAPGRAEGTTGRARPISDLIAAFESGEKDTGGKPWAEMSPKERSELIDSHRLAYVSHAPVNWCPGLGTVLANEEVTNEGRSERGNYPVFKRQLRQWMMRITDYADRLADELDTVDWPDKVVTMQRNWIGRSEGASVIFEAAGHELEVFTTRPDTLFGATFMVVSPEHPLVEGGLPEAWPEGTKEAWTGGEESPAKAVAAYRAKAANLTEAEAAEREKTGIFTGFFATNPVNGAKIPVFTADYVLMSYGTGAIMAVPAHDERDYDFAVRFELPIITTIEAPEGTEVDGAYVGDGVIVNSANDEISLNGMGKDEAIATMSTWLAERGIGAPTITYRLRDWLFSRQRYWGEPFPVVYDEEGLVHALPEDMLPVSLPDTPDYSPRSYDPDDADSAPEPPLGRLKDWVKVELDLGEGTKTYYRDTNTMPNWAGSCWYEMRYLDPNNDEIFCAPENEEYWMGPRPEKGNLSGGADLYVGGVEHAVLHLLYARFWHKVLYDLGHVSSSEPFHKLFNQGMIEAYAYTDSRGQYVPADEVEEVERGGQTVYLYEGAEVNREYGKIGKSLKNVVSPDEICTEYGADTFRTYEMSMGPLEQSRPWDSRAIVGSLRFLQRLWRNIVDETTGEVTVVDEEPDEKTAKLAARTIADVRTEYEAMRPNTAISKLIVYNNHLTSLKRVPRVCAEQIVSMVAPVAPHITEELWERLGHEDSVVYAPFPTADESLLVEDTVTCVIQVRGKVRDRIEVPTDISDEDLTAAALGRDKVQSYLEGEPRKIIVRAPGLINIVP